MICKEIFYQVITRASDAVVHAATNEKYQKAVGNAVASQAANQENQKVDNKVCVKYVTEIR